MKTITLQIDDDAFVSLANLIDACRLVGPGAATKLSDFCGLIVDATRAGESKLFIGPANKGAKP